MDKIDCLQENHAIKKDLLITFDLVLVESELADAQRRIQSLEHHADALLLQGSSALASGDPSQVSLCTCDYQSICIQLHT